MTRPAASPAITVDFLREEILSDARLVYQAREQAIGSESMRELERRVVLSVIGRKWQEHLYEMDYLKEGIGLRAMAQRDPLVEYQREGFIMFQAMMEAIREESVGFLFNLDVEVTPAEDVVVADAEGQHTEHHEPQIHAAGTRSPGEAGAAAVHRPRRRRRRPDPDRGEGLRTLGKPGQGRGAGHRPPHCEEEAALGTHANAREDRNNCSGPPVFAPPFPDRPVRFLLRRACSGFCRPAVSAASACGRAAQPISSTVTRQAAVPRSSRNATARTRDSSTTTALAS